jgi:RimJ/RimL family protein N-acetyltransferase
VSVTYRIVTDRLVLRCWEPRDAPLLKAAIDASLAHLADMPWIDAEPQTVEQKVALLRRFRGQFDLDEDYVYGIFDRAQSHVLGGCGLHTRPGGDAREIGYWIHVDHAGRGLATEAAGALTRVGFELSSLDRIEIHCGPTNSRSARVAQKLGYTLEATLRRRLMLHGEPRDTMIWSLFADAYPGS